jgi:hypothetical protein
MFSRRVRASAGAENKKPSLFSDGSVYIENENFYTALK